MGRGRWLYFAKKAQELKLKILLYGPDGYYIGGDRAVPTLIAPFSGGGFSSIQMYGITATGPGLADWVASGRGLIGSTAYAVFYNSTGLIRSVLYTDPGSFLDHYAGHFATVRIQEAANPSTNIIYQWATPTADGIGTGLASDGDFGFVLPNVLTQAQNTFEGFLVLRGVAALDPSLSHAISRGDRISPSTNPNLFFAGGSYVKLSQNLNTSIPKSDLIWPTLYVKAQSFYFASAFSADTTASLAITPYTLDTSGGAVAGSAFTIQYQQNAGFEPIDASYHP